MNSLFKGLIVVFGLTLATCSPLALCPSATKEQAQKAEAALADFAVNLYKNVSAKDQDKNEIMSPVSVALALALLENGADGNTRDALKRVLVENGGSSDVLATYRAIQQQLSIDDQNTKLNIANGLFQDKDLKLKQQYLDTTKECYQTEVDQVDFRNQLEQTRQKVNQWVSQRTSQKIPELFKKNSLNQDDRMVLANAIYFKASWAKAFNKAATKQDTFYKNGRDQEKQTVQYMHETSSHRHSESNDLTALELAYSHQDLSMVVVLPKARDGLRNLEKRLTGKQLRDIISNMEERKVNVQLPKFAVRSQIDLKSTLSKMGLESMFSNSANFDRMSETPLKVDNGVHEAYINVNENGTEAAAATGFAISNRAMPILPVDPVSFVADHPFLYAVVHKQTGAVVFLGKVNSVEQQQE
jgi:serpin B